MLPEKVRFPESSNLPLVPARTTLPDDKFATLVTPAMLTLSKFV